MNQPAKELVEAISKSANRADPFEMAVLRFAESFLSEPLDEYDGPRTYEDVAKFLAARKDPKNLEALAEKIRRA